MRLYFIRYYESLIIDFMFFHLVRKRQGQNTPPIQAG